MRFLICFLTFIQLITVNLVAVPLAPVYAQGASQKAERAFIEDIP